MKRNTGYTSDDGKVGGTKAEVERYEALQALQAWFDNNVVPPAVGGNFAAAVGANPRHVISLIRPLITPGERRKRKSPEPKTKSAE